MLRRTIRIALALPLLLLAGVAPLSARGGREAAPAEATPAADGPAAGGAAAGFPLSLTDDLGRRVTVAKLPRRIVSLSPSGTEILFTVGAGDQVVGVTEFCTWPQEARTRPSVGGFIAKTISVERVLALQPDLVISGGSHQLEVIEALAGAGVSVYALDAQTFAEVYDALRLTGRLTGHEAEAEKRVQAMRALEGRVAALAATIPPERKLKVFWEVWDDPLMTVGSATFLSEAIALAGGINIFADLKAEYPLISVEEVIFRDPDVILGPQDHAEALNPQKIARRPGWSNVRAVRDGRIHVLDSDITSRPGARIAGALGLIARALYPEEFRGEFGDSDPMGW